MRGRGSEQVDAAPPASTPAMPHRPPQPSHPSPGPRPSTHHHGGHHSLQVHLVPPDRVHHLREEGQDAGSVRALSVPPRAARAATASTGPAAGAAQGRPPGPRRCGRAAWMPRVGGGAARRTCAMTSGVLVRSASGSRLANSWAMSALKAGALAGCSSVNCMMESASSAPSMEVRPCTDREWREEARGGRVNGGTRWEASASSTASQLWRRPETPGARA